VGGQFDINMASPLLSTPRRTAESERADDPAQMFSPPSRRCCDTDDRLRLRMQLDAALHDVIQITGCAIRSSCQCPKMTGICENLRGSIGKEEPCTLKRFVYSCRLPPFTPR
jgi:hypothetical protein